MIDFNKLRDPVHIAQTKAEREAESARLEAEAKRTWSAVNALGDPDVEGLLSDVERRFVNNCRSLVSRQYVLTPKQQEWLFSLADRFAPAWQGAAPEPEHDDEGSAPSP